MRLTVGKITKPHGIRGEVVIDVRTDDPAARFAVGSVLTTDSAEMSLSSVAPATLTVRSVRSHQDHLLVLFAGFEDRNRAETLRGALLSADGIDIGCDDPDEFSDHELVGLVAVDADGVRLGTIVRVDHGPATDLLVLRQQSGRTSLVPFVKAIVPQIDVAGGQMVLTPPEGLLDL